ncbi:acetamidase/formamidase family protein [Amycolatopsis cynarae]|uniref:Acetamidase/formamidase family protein n=1 Tax=Amycolatopsis cynarae TaxID=2995223 RepID=A0ABY7B9N2_9PSEU|nr:acetamidase/formamidase family protein [Amycolatopsis sp. HUAS 11-8]WAL68856.1 acetamidase/formamidase family protein [Amycolatopsis sp. HUAS 11-8]
MTTVPASPVRQALAPESAPERYVPATLATTRWGFLPCEADAPVLAVSPGETVTFDTVSHEGILEDQGRDPVAFFGAHGIEAADVLGDAITIAAHGSREPGAGPHVVTGPVVITGAEPGDLLEVRIDRLEPRAFYGVISSRHGRGLLPGRFPVEGPNTSVFCRVEGLEDGVGAARATLPLRPSSPARPVRFPIAPFLGVIGVATPGKVRLHSVPPGRHGGNIDINMLVEGTTLYLPVQVRGAGLYVGDPHFAQGNGEIALTALEAPLRATLTVDVIPHGKAVERYGRLTGPFARTPEFLVPTGMNADLDLAVAECGQNAVTLLTALFGMDPELAYAYLSAATDFEISQVVDQVKGAHARIRLADFTEVHQ